MRPAALFSLVAALVLACPLSSAPISRDLGLGLVYHRVHALPDDLPTDESSLHRPCILDVRYVHGDSAAAATLLAWLKFHATPKDPVFLLANHDTSPVLLAPLASPDAVAGLVILGAAEKDFEPDIALRVAPGVERRAYEALEKGTSIESLITEKLDKPRDDEALLVREHLPDSALPREVSESDSIPAPSRTPPALIDAALQRAVQLHRALRALKRF